MLAAAQIYLHGHGPAAIRCAKYHHHNDQRCIFRCGYAPATATAQMHEE
jgi:aquaporin Z